MYGDKVGNLLPDSVFLALDYWVYSRKMAEMT